MNIAYEKLIQFRKNKKQRLLEERINKSRQEALERGVIRTYNFQRNKVKNHLNGNSASLKHVLNGDIDLIR